MTFQNFRKQFDGFEKLYERFLQETGPSVDWDKILTLPDGAVSYLPFSISIFGFFNSLEFSILF